MVNPCPNKSVGAQIDQILPGAMSGNTIMSVRFFCKNCHPEPFQIMSVALWPNYEVSPYDGGLRYTLRRLSREQAIARVKASRRV